ncbi:hypothetical protein ACHQM5_007654 [Ranunculus cassubicifolius]
MGFYMEEEGTMKCRKHPLKHRGTGVCPICLRDRLIRLCPDCANVRPCACYPTTSSSSSSSSFSLSSSIDVPASLGAIGRVSNLIDNEPAFQRSRSAKFPFLRSKLSSKDSSVNHNLLPPLGHNRSKSSFWSSIFKPQQKVEKVDDEMREEEERIKLNNIKMMRSRSVGMPCDNSAAAAVASDMRLKGRSWYFPSPIKAFRSSKNSSSKFLQERSPLCRG